MTVSTSQPENRDVPGIGVPVASLFRVTVDQYHRMVEAGVFATDTNRLEMLSGWIVEKHPGPSQYESWSEAETGLPFPPDHFWRATVDQYHQMIEADIFGDEQNIELLNGWLIHKMNKNPSHSTMVEVVRDVIADVLPDGWVSRSEQPISTADSEPEPDVSVVRGRKRDYLNSHPVAEQVGFVVEIANTSLKRDRELKGPLYGHAKIPQFWVVNLVDAKVEVYTNPSASAGQGYVERIDYEVGESVPVMLGGSEVARIEVEELLP